MRVGKKPSQILLFDVDALKNAANNKYNNRPKTKVGIEDND